MQFLHEASLVKDLCAGDQQAVKRWYLASKDKLSGFFVRQVGSSEDAAELTQDTYISCLRALPLYRGQSSLYSWMLGIARHELADYWRKKYAKRAIALLPFGQELLETIGSKDKITGTSEIQDLLSNLPQEITELLQLKYIDGYSVKELAAHYGLSPAAMQSRIFRAKELFRQEYERQESQE